VLPCLIFEDEHLLVVNKPCGLNTHAPSPFAGEGIYDWLRHREPRWAGLAIVHRLDKETSGVMVFGKTPLANRSLTGQFTRHTLRKRYLLLTDRRPTQREFVVRSNLIRTGERYRSNPRGEPAETRFRVSSAPDTAHLTPGTLFLTAEPLTGRTHQIRVHAAESGFPILGDTLYGGSPFARVCLHAVELALHHPATGRELVFAAPIDFAENPRTALRTALIDAAETNAARWIHGASDGWPGWYVDCLGEFLHSQSEGALSPKQTLHLGWLAADLSRRTLAAPEQPGKTRCPPRIATACHKILDSRARHTAPELASPKLILGRPAPARFIIRENGLQYELSFGEGCSVGLFLDQRDNRRRLLTGHVAAGFSLFDPLAEPANSRPDILNLFAYTCSFSVCAARAGARTTSLDLSKNYLAWGRRNFELNGLDPAGHDFIYGDVFDWLRRLAKKGRRFEVIIVDPPTFSQSRERGVFRAEKDYGKLVGAALPLLKPGGVLFCSTNAAEWLPDRFLAAVEQAVRAARRTIVQRHYVPQPPDFPVSRSEPAYLKTVWMRVK
jgi:23S rRNA (cytosine1962-C5)-methyltransferase